MHAILSTKHRYKLGMYPKNRDMIPADILDGPLAAVASCAGPVGRCTSVLLALRRQVEFFFGDANLARDAYLRSQLDAHGWCHLATLLSFPTVRRLTCDPWLLVTALSTSPLLQVSWLTSHLPAGGDGKEENPGMETIREPVLEGGKANTLDTRPWGSLVSNGIEEITEPLSNMRMHRGRSCAGPPSDALMHGRPDAGSRLHRGAHAGPLLGRSLSRMPSSKRLPQQCSLVVRRDPAFGTGIPDVTALHGPATSAPTGSGTALTGGSSSAPGPVGARLAAAAQPRVRLVEALDGSGPGGGCQKGHGDRQELRVQQDIGGQNRHGAARDMEAKQEKGGKQYAGLQQDGNGLQIRRASVAMEPCKYHAAGHCRLCPDAPPCHHGRSADPAYVALLAAQWLASDDVSAGRALLRHLAASGAPVDPTLLASAVLPSVRLLATNPLGSGQSRHSGSERLARQSAMHEERRARGGLPAPAAAPAPSAGSDSLIGTPRPPCHGKRPDGNASGLAAMAHPTRGALPTRRIPPRRRTTIRQSDPHDAVDRCSTRGGARREPAAQSLLLPHATQQPFGHYVVLDLEGQDEIIELPAILLAVETATCCCCDPSSAGRCTPSAGPAAYTGPSGEAAHPSVNRGERDNASAGNIGGCQCDGGATVRPSLREVTRFHRWVRPGKLFAGKRINPHSPAVPLSQALDELMQGSTAEGAGQADVTGVRDRQRLPFAMVTCGNWDIPHIARQCAAAGLPLPRYFRRQGWVNLKRSFDDLFHRRVVGAAKPAFRNGPGGAALPRLQGQWAGTGGSLKILSSGPRVYALGVQDGSSEGSACAVGSHAAAITTLGDNFRGKVTQGKVTREKVEKRSERGALQGNCSRVLGHRHGKQGPFTDDEDGDQQGMDEDEHGGHAGEPGVGGMEEDGLRGPAVPYQKVSGMGDDDLHPEPEGRVLYRRRVSGMSEMIRLLTRGPPAGRGQGAGGQQQRAQTPLVVSGSFHGFHHLGMHDTENLARVAQRIVERGGVLALTSRLPEELGRRGI
eukprot:jgi/Mesvir1/1849/Mv06949-RA.1